MRICFLNRGREAYSGGDTIALDYTMAALRKQGVECEETGWDVERMRNGRFDLAHVVHCNFSWSFGNYCAVREAGLPYVVQSVYYPGPLLSGITESHVREILGNAQRILPFSRREAQEMIDEAMVQDGWNRITCIPNGTDPKFHCTETEGREGVLCVAARAGDKNTGMVRRICEELGLPFTLATGIPHEEMPAVYKRHKVFVNASESERMSLTVGEALCAGCRVIDSEGNRGNEWYPYLLTFDPNEEWLMQMIHDAATNRPGRWVAWEYYGVHPNAAARALTWDATARQIIDVYRSAIG